MKHVPLSISAVLLILLLLVGCGSETTTMPVPATGTAIPTVTTLVAPTATKAPKTTLGSTPEPTDAPQPTNTLTPTASPTPTDTPRSTITPEPTATQTALDQARRRLGDLGLPGDIVDRYGGIVAADGVISSHESRTLQFLSYYGSSQAHLALALESGLMESDRSNWDVDGILQSLHSTRLVQVFLGTFLRFCPDEGGNQIYTPEETVIQKRCADCEDFARVAQRALQLNGWAIATSPGSFNEPTRYGWFVSESGPGRSHTTLVVGSPGDYYFFDTTERTRLSLLGPYQTLEDIGEEINNGVSGGDCGLVNPEGSFERFWNCRW